MPTGRVRTRAAFRALRERGRRARHGSVRVTWLPADAGPAAAAYAVGRAVGPAVVRNRVRRRLRAAIHDLGPAPGTYLVAVGPGAGAVDGAALRSDLAAALRELGALA